MKWKNAISRLLEANRFAATTSPLLIDKYLRKVPAPVIDDADHHIMQLAIIAGDAEFMQVALAIHEYSLSLWRNP